MAKSALPTTSGVTKLKPLRSMTEKLLRTWFQVGFRVGFQVGFQVGVSGGFEGFGGQNTFWSLTSQPLEISENREQICKAHGEDFQAMPVWILKNTMSDRCVTYPPLEWQSCFSRIETGSHPGNWVVYNLRASTKFEYLEKHTDFTLNWLNLPISFGN